MLHEKKEHKTKIDESSSEGLNPSTPISDQDRISPYSINTISSRKVMRMKKNINKGIVRQYDSKFFVLNSYEVCDRQ